VNTEVGDLSCLITQYHCLSNINFTCNSVVDGTVTKTTRQPIKASVFRAELYAILLAMLFIFRSEGKNFLIFCDFVSNLEV